MKARIVIEANKVVGYQLGEDNSPVPGQFRGGLMAGPGQQLQEVEIPDEFALVANPEDVHKRLATYIAKKAA